MEKRGVLEFSGKMFRFYGRTLKFKFYKREHQRSCHFPQNIQGVAGKHSQPNYFGFSLNFAVRPFFFSSLFFKPKIARFLPFLAFLNPKPLEEPTMKS